MRWFLLALCLSISLISCEEDEQVDDNFIVSALKSAHVVTIDAEQTVRIGGIIVGTYTGAVTTGCFGIPTCVRMDEVNRGIIKKDIDDFSLYAEAEAASPPDGVSYFLTDFFGPYWATNGTYQSMRGLINATGGTYPGKRVGWCNNHPARCVQE